MSAVVRLLAKIPSFSSQNHPEYPLASRMASSFRRSWKLATLFLVTALLLICLSWTYCRDQDHAPSDDNYLQFTDQKQKQLSTNQGTREVISIGGSSDPPPNKSVETWLRRNRQSNVGTGVQNAETIQNQMAENDIASEELRERIRESRPISARAGRQIRVSL